MATKSRLIGYRPVSVGDKCRLIGYGSVSVNDKKQINWLTVGKVLTRIDGPASSGNRSNLERSPRLAEISIRFILPIPVMPFHLFFSFFNPYCSCHRQDSSFFDLHRTRESSSTDPFGLMVTISVE